MSTVDKKTADRVIAGDFPEDDIICIIRYENIFNGNYAYKLIFSHQEDMIQPALDGKFPAMIDCTIYWKA
jgi:hypothetical protein